MLKIAIQKKGRLSEGSIALLKEAGLNISTNSGKLKQSISTFPAEVLYLRDDDIPQYVSEGVADIGFVGENTVLEKNKKTETLLHLGFAKCRLSLAVKREEKYTGLDWFNGKKIATSYPLILRKFLDENHISATIEEISGSVEIAPGIGLASGICDLVSSGSTLFSNGLVEVQRILESEAVLIVHPGLSPEKRDVLNKLKFRIDAVQKADAFKYILLNAPKDKLDCIVKLLPGINSPTVSPLASSDWVSVQSVIEKATMWEIIDQLRQNGAEGILICSIDKMIG